MTWKERLVLNGLRRRRNGDGFQYLHADGTPAGSGEVSRIRALRIPPAWTDVFVNHAAAGRVQAVGTDAAGRLQYLYHPDHERAREKRKRDRMLRFGAALPRLRTALREDLRESGFGRRRVMAAMVGIIWRCAFRPGSRVYARDNGSVGLTTIGRRHVRVRGALVTFDFPGKSGRRQQAELSDRRIAALIGELLRAPGRHLFRWCDEEGVWHDATRRHLNEYLRETLGPGFSAKDFRTWTASLTCALALARDGAVNGAGRAEMRKRIAAAMRETAERLGNTPAVCRSAYVSPVVLGEFEKGRLIAFRKRPASAPAVPPPLHPAAERALLRLLTDRGAAAAH